MGRAIQPMTAIVATALSDAALRWRQWEQHFLTDLVAIDTKAWWNMCGHLEILRLVDSNSYKVRVLHLVVPKFESLQYLAKSVVERGCSNLGSSEDFHPAR